jgi:transcriptional regulator with GAF, ATPase, and Fis domain/Tfp pilus assembly protein PilF
MSDHGKELNVGPSAGFFGRQREFERLLHVMEEARDPAAPGRAILITGPAGVGKSRLMTELRRHLRQARETVFEGHCRSTDHRPYGLLVRMLGEAATLVADLGLSPETIERTLNLIAGLGSEEGPSRTWTGRPGEDQLRFFEAARNALLDLCRVRPPVLMLHDLHRADAATLELVRYLVENLITDPAFDWVPDAEPTARDSFRGLLVVSFRETEQTRPLLGLARTSRSVEHLPLGGLDEEGVRAYLQSPEVVERFLAASEGLPVALEQLVDAQPDHYSELWGRRLEHVSDETRPLLEAMSVYAHPVTPQQLRELMGDDRPLLPLLNELVDRRIVTRTISHGEVRFRFVRTGARNAFYRMLEQDRRHALHLRVADRLAQMGGIGVEPEEVAEHYLAADAVDAAIPFAMAAADRLHAAFADARATELLERVAPAASGPQRCRLLDRLASLYTRTGDYARAEQVLETLLDEFREAARTLAVERRLAEVLLLAGKPDEARTRADGALPDEADPDERGRLIAIGAEAAYQHGALDDAEARCAAYEDHDPADPRTADLLNTLGKLHLARERLDQSQEIFARSLAAADAAGNDSLRIRALVNLGIVFMQRGMPEHATEHFEDAKRLAEETGDLWGAAMAVKNLAVLHHRRQEYSRALPLYHQSSALLRKLGRSASLTHSALNLADLYLDVGDIERARRLCDIARDYGTRVREGYARGLRRQLEAELARADGTPDRAATLYAEAAEHTEDGSHLRSGRLLCARAEVELERGELEAAAKLLDEAAGLPAEHQSEALAAQIRMTRGAVWAAGGDPESARIELEAAAEGFESVGDREALWRARHRLARVHWALGDRSATLRGLATAVDTIESIGADLPESLRPTYLESEPRQSVRRALLRVRAGAGPDEPVRTQSPDSGRLERAVGAYSPHWTERYPRIIGRAPALHPVFNTLDRVAGSDSMVLLRGESGTGKELVAAALHAHSPRAGGPFVKVNCAAFVETLLLSELFGHEKGAFTGALARKKGRFELADRGTLFLDEIGDISPNTQVALLRVLQEAAFERVGGAETLRVDVRVVCATHRNLEEMVHRGAFRADLYYRLRGVILELPALRDRRDDIPLLVDHFLARRPRASERPLRFTPEALASLLQHDWPGNVRELENVVRSVALFADGERIGLSELAELGDIFRPPEERWLRMLAESDLLDEPPTVQAAPPPEVGPAPENGNRERTPDTTLPDTPAAVDAGGDPIGADADDDAESPLLTGDWIDQMLRAEGSLSDVKKRVEFEAIARALRATNGNITRAAERLGMKRPRLSQIIHATPELGELKREVSGA